MACTLYLRWLVGWLGSWLVGCLLGWLAGGVKAPRTPEQPATDNAPRAKPTAQHTAPSNQQRDKNEQHPPRSTPPRATEQPTPGKNKRTRPEHPKTDNGLLVGWNAGWLVEWLLVGHRMVYFGPIILTIHLSLIRRSFLFDGLLWATSSDGLLWATSSGLLRTLLCSMACYGLHRQMACYGLHLLVYFGPCMINLGCCDR